jgi:hypothetical protein
MVMARMAKTTDWRAAIQNSRMLCLFWSPAPAAAAIQRTQLAFAMALGKPIRLLLRTGTRLPEDLCVGYADLRVARVAHEADVGRQITVWLAELEEQEGGQR